MARKKEETLFRFIGGFVQCETLEVSARREVQEEAHIEISEPQFLGSHIVDDWRYRREMDKIMTCLFEAEHTFGIPTPDDDIFELRWFEAADIHESDLVAEHRPLLKILCAKSKLRFAKREEKATGWTDGQVIPWPPKEK
jgi:NADH pyrophosphatase NudC (nudix superfamily)